MKTKFCIFIIIFSVFVSLVQANEENLREPPEKYKKWLEEEVQYIISPVEKDVFLHLETDRERDLFIEAFWKHRDKILGTPENEYKKEHYRRINHANYHFGRTTAKPGWKTDRGRIYIILGVPRQTESLIGETQIYNTEIWTYEGFSKFGLPPVFNLVFFQKDGVGEYILYSPSQHGPQALMTSYWGDQTDYLSAFRALANLAPTLAKVSLSLIPGEQTPYYYGRPSIASDLLFTSIYSIPQKEVKDVYAEKFLQFKDIIEVEYSANYIDNDSLVRVLKDPSGNYFVHYIVELMKFSVQLLTDKYSTYFKVNGLVSDLDGKIIYQYEKSIFFKLDETQLKNITYKPFDLYDMFPLLPGQYMLSIIIKNEVSKEFTSLEESITVPEDNSLLWMSPLILSYKMDPTSFDSKTLKPFKLGQNQIYCQPKRVFQSQDTLFTIFQIHGLTSSMKKKGQLRFEFFKGSELFLSLTKKVNEYQDNINFKEEFSLQKFLPDYYRIRITLLEDNEELFYEEKNFEITPLSTLPRPWTHSITIPPVEDPTYSSILGKQYYNKGAIDKARAYFEAAYHKKPNSMDYALNLAKVYFLLKEYVKIKQVLSSWSESSSNSYEVLRLLGKSHQALGEFNKAIEIFNKAISHFGIDINLLNSLGECYYRLGSTDKALAAWEKSLEVNPDQPIIKKKIKDIKK